MRVFQLIVSVITALLMFFTIVCGLWIKSQGDKIVDKAGALQFHTTIGITTAIFVAITVITIFIKKQ